MFHLIAYLASGNVQALPFFERVEVWIVAVLVLAAWVCFLWAGYERSRERKYRKKLEED